MAPAVSAHLPRHDPSYPQREVAELLTALSNWPRSHPHPTGINDINKRFEPKLHAFDMQLRITPAVNSCLIIQP
jgi:hypothetical protein